MEDGNELNCHEFALWKLSIAQNCASLPILSHRVRARTRAYEITVDRLYRVVDEPYR